MNNRRIAIRLLKLARKLTADGKVPSPNDREWNELTKFYNDLGKEIRSINDKINSDLADNAFLYNKKTHQTITNAKNQLGDIAKSLEGLWIVYDEKLFGDYEG